MDPMRRVGPLLVAGCVVAGCGSSTKGPSTVQHSQAYSDGYQTTQVINENQGVIPDAGSDLRGVCVSEASSPVGGAVSTHDNFDQWVQGCMAYLNLASRNTGGTGGTGNTGNTGSSGAGSGIGT
jgi:hypothetical protein